VKKKGQKGARVEGSRGGKKQNEYMRTLGSWDSKGKRGTKGFTGNLFCLVNKSPGSTLLEQDLTWRPCGQIWSRLSELKG